MGRNTFLKSLEANGINLNNNNRLIIKEYIDNMPTCMAAADLVISRCGANALCELENMGRGSILIPSPIVAENHQYHNGMVFRITSYNVCYTKLLRTTITTVLKQVLTGMGYKVGLIGTSQNEIGDKILHTERTTPEPFDLFELYSRNNFV